VFNSEQLGLFVVGQLAKRHGIRVTLRPSPYGGTSAITLIPTSLVSSDDGFMEALPAGAAEWPTQETPQLTGGPAWDALPQGNGSPAVASAAPGGPNGANGNRTPGVSNGSGVSNGAGAGSEPAVPADPFESYTGPSFGTDPYAPAGNGNGGAPAFGFMTPPAERSSFTGPAQAPFGTTSDEPSETGLPWPYDRPAPAGTPSFTPAEPPAGDATGTRPPFPPAPFPRAEPDSQPPYPPIEAAEPPYPAAADDQAAAQSDSPPSLPMRRRTGSQSQRPEQPQQFGAEPPSFTPNPTPFADEPRSFTPPSPSFTPNPTPFADEPPSFTPPSPSFTPNPTPFADEPPSFTPGATAIGGDQPAGPEGTDGDVDESYKGLPRRVRQASLAPQLRDAAPATSSPGAASGDNVANRSPDDIRSALSAMQRGWQQGREDVLGDRPGSGSVASGHLPSGAEAENNGNGDEGSHGGNDES
jgi:hypothetical protein